MKKIFIILSTVVLGAIGMSFAATLSVPGDHATIQAAINAANPGDEILIADGAYSENLTIAKSLTLIGASEGGVVITPITNGYGIEVTADNVRLENFTLQNSQHYGIKAAKCTACGYLTNLTIENVTVLNSAKSHIDLNGVQNSLINNVIVTNTPSGVGIGLQNNVNVTVSNVSSTNNAWGGVGVWSTTKPDYPTAAGTNGVVIQNLQYSGVPYGLYTQQTNPVLVAPTANQFVCTVTSTNTAVRADIEEFVFYFKTKVEADAFATVVDGTTVCQTANGSTPMCEDGKMYARVNTAYEGDMWYGNQLLTPNSWFALGSSQTSVQPEGFVMTFDGTKVTSMFLPLTGNPLVIIQGSIEVYGTQMANILPISLEDNEDNDQFTANATSGIDFKFTITNDNDGGSFDVQQEQVVCPEVCIDNVMSTQNTTVDAVTHTTIAPLVTTTNVLVGDMLSITADGLWRAGESDEPFSRESDANGLTGYDEHEGFKFGSLVGRIGAGPWFFIGTDYSGLVTTTGTLQLVYWDSGHEDNSGSVAVAITKTTTAEVECPIGCGDGIINNEEQCDDGNVINGDGCNSQCQTEGVGVCGDGQVNQQSEQCDDGNQINTDSCTNICQNRSSGGGAASSIGGGNSTPNTSNTPNTLPETGPEDGTGDEDMTLAEAMDQIDSTTIAACNEDTYILDRLMKLQRVSYDMVYTVPAELSALIGADVLRAKTQLMQTLRDLSTTKEKNDAVRALVCKIEIIKQARGLRHANIGYKSGGRTVLSDYLLQYLQDIAIMEFVK